MRSMVSRSRTMPLVSRRLLVRSSCRSACTSLPPRMSSRRFRRSSVRMRISSERFFSSLAICVAFDGLGALVLFLALAGEDLHVHDHALDARRAVERSVANVAGLFAEDGAQQFFFRRELGLALGRDLADQDVALLDRGADADHAASSRSRSMVSLTLGMSRVTSSGPSLVSRASISNSSMCTEV